MTTKKKRRLQRQRKREEDAAAIRVENEGWWIPVLVVAVAVICISCYSSLAPRLSSPTPPAHIGMLADAVKSFQAEKWNHTIGLYKEAVKQGARSCQYIFDTLRLPPRISPEFCIFIPIHGPTTTHTHTRKHLQ